MQLFLGVQGYRKNGERFHSCVDELSGVRVGVVFKRSSGRGVRPRASKKASTIHFHTLFKKRGLIFL